MNKTAVFGLIFSAFVSSAVAQTVERDSFEVGVEAYNAGNCREALRIMKKYEKEQPSAAYVVQVCELMLEKEEAKGVSYAAFLRDLRKGDLTRLDKIGMVDRLQVEISGLSGAMYLRNISESAKRGDAEAAFQMGLLYQEGIGVERDFDMAAQHFATAAKAGIAKALNTIGLYTRFGIGTDKDENKAEEYFKQAIVKGNAYALYNLGQMYADKKDFMQAWMLADLGVKKISADTEKAKNMRVKSLLKQADKQLSVFNRAYLEKYRPFWLKPAVPATEKVRIPAELPMPPQKMIEETSFMKFIKKDEYDNRYKVFYPLMPAWVDLPQKNKSNPVLEGKTPPFPYPEDGQVISALYFRPSDPRYINLTLKSEQSAVPVMVGDVLTLGVYTPLHETRATRKGGHMYIKNTDYTVKISDPAGIVGGNGSYTLTPLSRETMRQETWLSRSFVIRKTGTALIGFVAAKDAAGKDVFPYTVKIVATKGKPPK